jgi:hypothetical protein
MGHHDRPAAALNNVKEGPDGTVDPIGVADLPSLYDVMIKPDKDNLPIEVGILN